MARTDRSVVLWDERYSLVTNVGLSEIDTSIWWNKFIAHRKNAVKRRVNSELTFAQYLQKVVDAGLFKPEQIGRQLGQHQLGRIGDIGPYTVESCRFILTTQNQQEKIENGLMDHVAMGATRRGRTKETHPAHLAQATALAREFVIVDPDGKEHRGENVADFSRAHGLNKGTMAAVLRGKWKAHKGWSGHYVGTDRYGR